MLPNDCALTSPLYRASLCNKYQNANGNGSAIYNGSVDNVYVINGAFVWTNYPHIGLRDSAIASVSSAASALSGTLLYYKLATPQLIDLGYIDMPAIESGDAISVSASIVPVIDATWWCYDDVTDIIRDLKTYVDYKTADEQDPTAGLNMSRPANISMDTQAEQPAIIEESEMI